MRPHRTQDVLLAFFTLLSLVALPLAAATPQLRGRIETTIGMEGVYYLRYQGPALEAKKVDDSAPVVVRIADVARDGPVAIYELRYIGTRAGSFDLRELLQRLDGQPLEGVDPLPVVVASLLPADADGQLGDLRAPPLPWSWPYRVLVIVGALVWLLPLAWMVLRRRKQRRVQPGQASEIPLTLADQLRPLATAAIAGRLSTADQARLELLLLAHWRERLALFNCPTLEAIDQMRTHPEAGQLLRQLEQWLYERPGEAPVDVTQVLAPYSSQPAIEPGTGELRNGAAQDVAR